MWLGACILDRYSLLWNKCYPKRGAFLKFKVTPTHKSILQEILDRLYHHYPSALYLPETCQVVFPTIKKFDYDKFCKLTKKIYPNLQACYDWPGADVNVATSFCLAVTVKSFSKFQDKMAFICERLSLKMNALPTEIYYISTMIYFLSENVVEGIQRFLDYLEDIDCFDYQIHCKEEYLMICYLALIDLNQENEALLAIDWEQEVKRPNHLKMLYEFVQQYAPDKITTHSQYASFAYQIIENHIQKIGEKL